MPLFTQVLEIGENLKVLMSEERMAVLTKEIDDWAAKKAEEDSLEVGIPHGRHHIFEHEFGHYGRRMAEERKQCPSL